MWNPLDEPTHIPELQEIHDRLRARYKEPCLEMLNEYWRILLSQRIEDRVQQRSVGGKEFAKRMRTWHIYSSPLPTLEQKIRKEQFVLHAMYDETVKPYDEIDQLLEAVEKLVSNAPTYLRKIPTKLGYPKYKLLYGCCGLHSPPIPAIGFTDCLCKTYEKLSTNAKIMEQTNEIQELRKYIQTARKELLAWKMQELRNEQNFLSKGNMQVQSIYNAY